MHKILITFLLLTSTFTQAQVAFQKIYGGTGIDEGRSIQLTTDGGCIIAGRTESFGNGSSDVYLLKVSSTGNFTWSKTFGGSGYDYGQSVQQTTDGGYIIAGATSSFSSSGAKVYLIKTDSNGNLLWSKLFGGSSSDFGWTVKQTKDGGYVLSASTGIFSPGLTSDNVYVVKTDVNGNLLWSMILGGDSEDWGYSIRQTSDSGYAVIGSTRSFGIITVRNIYLTRLNKNGNLLWSKAYGGTAWGTGTDIEQLNDNGFIITGDANDNGTRKAFLLRTDSSGNPMWTKTYGNSGMLFGTSVQKASDGGFSLAGYSYNGSSGNRAFQLHTDSSGNLLWSKQFDAQSESMYAKKSTDGGYYITGVRQSDVYLIKNDSNGISGCNESNLLLTVNSPTLGVLNPVTLFASGGSTNNPTTQVGSGGNENILCVLALNDFEHQIRKITIAPNPVSKEALISIPEADFNFSNCILHIYNVFGQEVVPLITRGSDSFIIQRGALSSGIYLCKIYRQHVLLGSGKIIIE